MLDIRISKVNRYEKDVKEYESAKREYGKIIFYGDSGFTRWSEKYGNRPLESELLSKDGEQIVLNHGLGGSTTEDLLYYYPRMVRDYKPKALVYMTYANDYCKGYSPAETMFLQSRIFEYARRDVPGIRIYACDMRPIIKNLGDVVAWPAYKSRYEEYNDLLERYCSKHEDCTLIRHIKSPLFFHDAKEVGDYEKVRKDIFIEDQVHFNQTGYDLYREFFRQELDEIL